MSTAQMKTIGLVLVVVLIVGWVTTYFAPASKLFRINAH